MKTCLYCAEQIQDDAIVCRFCGKELSTPKSQAVILPEPQPKRTLLYLAAVGLIAGAFLPWAIMTSILGSVSINGIQGDGIITAIFGLLIGLGALAYKDASKKIYSWFFLIISIAAGWLSVSKLFSIAGVISKTDLPTSLGIGLIITVLAAFLGFIGAVNTFKSTTPNIFPDKPQESNPLTHE